ncbi:MAG: hypothetical protein D4S01_10765 [Dehalococcoidia bacterium]|nr:MAG: hypothetical protein D4S01_10765 [Dehalococcoidia bacterium]
MESKTIKHGVRYFAKDHLQCPECNSGYERFEFIYLTFIKANQEKRVRIGVTLSCSCRCEWECMYSQDKINEIKKEREIKK